MGRYPVDGQPDRCTAQSKTTGKRCTKTVVPGRSVCRFHGGLGGRPIIHGRYSKSLGRLREAYEEARSDPGLLDLRDTIALLDVVVRKAAERAAELDTPDFRETALKLYSTASQATEPLQVQQHLSALGALLREGGKEDQALKELSASVERLAKRQEKAWDLRLTAANVINAKDMVALLGRFADIVLEEADADTATRIVQRVDREIMGEGPSADRLTTGGDPVGASVLDLQGRPDGVHDGDPGLGALEEAERDR